MGWCMRTFWNVSMADKDVLRSGGRGLDHGAQSCLTFNELALVLLLVRRAVHCAVPPTAVKQRILWGQDGRNRERQGRETQSYFTLQTQVMDENPELSVFRAWQYFKGLSLYRICGYSEPVIPLYCSQVKKRRHRGKWKEFRLQEEPERESISSFKGHMCNVWCISSFYVLFLSFSSLSFFTAFFPLYFLPACLLVISSFFTLLSSWFFSFLLSCFSPLLFLFSFLLSSRLFLLFLPSIYLPFFHLTFLLPSILHSFLPFYITLFLLYILHSFLPFILPSFLPFCIHSFLLSISNSFPP